MARKLSPGVHTVRIKTGKGSKTRLQRVKVSAKGQWKFLKNTSKTKGQGTSRSRKSPSNPRKRGNPSRSVNRTGKSKMLRTIGAVGAAEDVAWGFIGFSVLGKNVTALPMTRVIQGLAGHAFDRRGKARLVSGMLDLVTLWLAGGFGNGVGFGGGGAGVRRQLAKLSFL